MTASDTPAPEPYEIVGENMERTDWLTARMTGVGASDSPAVLCLSKYDGPYSCYATKVKAGDFGGDKEPRYRRLGREMEPMMLKLAAEEVGALAWTHTPGTILRSTTWPHMICTMDGKLHFRDDRAPLWCEVKTGADAEDWKNGVPDAVFAQNQHQLVVTGADELVVALFFTGWAADYAITRVKRDETYIQDVLLPAVDDFWWNHVVPKNEDGLDVDGNDYTRKALDHLHPLDTDEDAWVNCTGEEWLHKVDELEALAERRKEIEVDEKKLKNEFRQALGTGKKLLLDDGRYFSNALIPESAPAPRKAYQRFAGPYGKPR
ncbi:MAG: YqaJ viral recombinase family protein [Gemmatimonadota bacterium]